MTLRIRRYHSSDRSSIVELMNDFGDYLVAVDSMKRTRRVPEFGEHFTQKMLTNVRKGNGLVYVAEHEGRIIGFIGGVVLKQSKEDLFETIPSKAGRIIELFVSEQFRQKGIAATLMKKMEEYFRQFGCDACRVEVFGPNVGAQRFYRKLGYQDRSIDMIKNL